MATSTLYTLQASLMQSKAEAEGLQYLYVYGHYRERLTHIRGTQPTLPLAAQQFKAESETWEVYRPEDIFPGVDPTVRTSCVVDVQIMRSRENEEIHANRRQCSTDRGNHSMEERQGSSSPVSMLRCDHRTRSPLRDPLHERGDLDGNQGSEFDFLSDSQVSCFNCGREGHILAVCVGPVNEYGFIGGCPICNTKDHYFDTCAVPAGERESLEFSKLL